MDERQRLYDLLDRLGVRDKLAEREGQERVRHEVERMIDNDRRAG